MAGGLGTRMRPRTETVPKSMFEVAGRPFVDWQLERIVQAGYERVLLCIGHLGEQIRDHVGTRRGTAAIEYAEDGPKLLGTAGALRAALDLLEPTFLVTYGDSYLPFDYAGPLRDLDAHEDALGTMSVFKNEGQWDASNTQVEGERVMRYEKGGVDRALDHIDYGATALRRGVIAALPADEELALSDVQADLARQGKLRALLAPERFYEIGSEDGLKALEDRLKRAP